MKRKYYLIALFFLMTLGSCENYLSTKPTDFLNPTNFYQTVDQLNYARAGVYNQLGGNLWGTWGHYLMGWTADESYMNRSTLPGPYKYFYSSSDQYLTGTWSWLYNGINRANQVLAYIDNNPEINQKYRDQIRGEMLFLRGYFYFLLVQYWGGVPLKLQPTTDIINVDIPRATTRETYDQILKDMETAEPLVPRIDSIGFGGAVNKSAVRGLLARVNLFMAGEPLKDETRYAEASKWAKMVMDDQQAHHALNPSYQQVFINLAADKYDIKENIWEVEFWGNRSDQYTETGYVGWINGPVIGANNVNTGRADSYMNITSKMYDIFEDGDTRKWWDICTFSYPNTAVANGTKTISALPANDNAKNTMKSAKFRREFETLVPKYTNGTPENFPLVRYSDILLMYAEAENAVHNGPTPEAIKAVNDVRERGWSTGVRTITITNGGSGYTSAPTVTFSAGTGTGVYSNTAAATATITNGVVTGITLNTDPTGINRWLEGQYTTPPTITISGGGGSGATATATIWKKTDADLKAEQTADKQSFLAAIQDERMRELNGEGLRKSDLIRWGIFLKVNQDMGNLLQQQSPNQYFVLYYTNVSAKDLLMPIPSSEMTTNLSMVQNPGWN
jgi:hypothetical protein